MLIVVNGPETIKSRHLARQIYNTINGRDSITVGEFTVDATGSVAIVYNSDNEIVYDENSESSEAIADVFDEIQALLNNDPIPSIFHNREKLTSFQDDIDVNFEKGLLKIRELSRIGYDFPYPDDDFAENQELADSVKDAIITAYNNKVSNHIVISGAFSKYYIDQIRTALGASEVEIINITRNPSVSYAVHFSQPYPTTFTPDTTVQFQRSFDNSNSIYYEEEYVESFFNSQINCITLKDLDYVTTYKFEDLLVSGSITVNGTAVDISSIYPSTNNIITDNENVSVTADQVSSANNFFSSYTSLADYFVYDTASAELIATFDFTTLNLPSNFFTSLGYTSLTLAEITAGA